MKKFIFSLEKVLSFKQQTLDIQKNELLQMQTKLAEIEKEINTLNTLFAETNQKMKKELQTGLNASDMSIYKTYFNTLNQKILRLVEDKSKMLEAITQKKADIIALNSDISGLEKLRDKQHEAYLEAFRKREELAIDEFVNRTRSAAN
ncbi:flagellar export protein FliJ [Caproiciproducens galactitolivorans]|uniref:Flagellar FliJ protein n=1 Tax=Caproiciproducens galactitolivorans TaxID=642589 RepID=A0A4Z0YF97_9FIRM|nr:flagellar export protein FliJ [Caproiciproducens galactitolivorans]QEY34342.1 flagellar export protein FliJ [Caproiciproducens galactitolivorans]TGJ77891.1 flagellar biosynthesis chaperone [Caproiciproducens galactitolivorans]